MPARVMGTRGRDIGVSQGPKHHGEQGSSWALRCRFGGFGMGPDDEQPSIVRWDSAASVGPPRGADVWLADRDIEGCSLPVNMQTGIDCIGLLHCLVPDMICSRVPDHCRSLFIE